MTEAQLRAVLRQVAPLADRVTYHLMGEPTSHPDFPRFVDVAREEGARLEITTNGTLLSQVNMTALLAPAVEQVNFSLQSFSNNFPNASPDRWLSGILEFTRRALEERPDLYVNFRFWNLPSDALEDTENEAILTKIEEALSVTINRRVDPRLRKSKLLRGRLYIHYDTRFEWPSLSLPLLRSSGKCLGGSQQIAIHANGDVVPCCLDKEAAIRLGNIFETPLDEVLRSVRLAKLVTSFQRGELVEDLCRRCEFSTRF